MTKFSTEKNNKMIFLTPMVIFSGTALFGQMTFDRLLCEEIKALLLLLLLLLMLLLLLLLLLMVLRPDFFCRLLLVLAHLDLDLFLFGLVLILIRVSALSRNEGCLKWIKILMFIDYNKKSIYS